MTIKPPIVYRKRMRKQAEKDYGSKWIEYAFKDHNCMSERLRKTLYYGKKPKIDRPSLPVTEVAVEMFARAVPHSLGDINMDFASSVSRNACMSPCSMILAMAYLERLRSQRPEYLTNISSSNLFLVSMLVASKFLYDEGEAEEVFNDEWAVAANIETKEMNDLEMKFLSAIEWNVYMETKSFGVLLGGLERAVAGRKCKDRGWCTYTDVDVLTEQMDKAWCWQILNELIIKVVTISAVAYAASVLVLVGSVIATKHLEPKLTNMIASRCDWLESSGSISTTNSPLDETPSLLNIQNHQSVWVSTDCLTIENRTFCGGDVGSGTLVPNLNTLNYTNQSFNTTPFIDLTIAPSFR